jgi:transcriptional regulator with XRE-family HTH domain
MIQGHRLRQIREQRALSQGTLGKLVGKDAQYISKLERGVRLSVHTTTLGRLVTALEVSADYLLGFSDCEILPRSRGTSTPGRRQRQTAARHRHGSTSSSVARPTPPAPPDQTVRTVNTDSAVAVAACDQPAHTSVR